MTRYFLHLAYDGTHYCGWQIQPAVKTVQETIEKALAIFVKDLHGIVGCGRTDTGVHARDYYAHFNTSLEVPEEIVYKLNAVLPRDIAVYDCFKVDDKLHARFSARERTYKYFVHYSKDPFKNAYSVYHNGELHLESLNQASAYLLGRHDFSSFSRSQTQVSTNICNVFHAKWEPLEGGAVFTISANRFLRNMVRAIAGTMFSIGSGKTEPNSIVDILAAMDRKAAGKSAHPQGLFLEKIIYPTLHGPGIR